MVETIDLLAYRSDFATAARAFEVLLAKPNVSIAAPVPMEGTRVVHQRSGGSLSLADAVVVQTCRMWGCSPLTFDLELQRAAQ